MLVDALAIFFSLFSLLFPATAQIYCNSLPFSRAYTATFKDDRCNGSESAQGEVVAAQQQRCSLVNAKKRCAIVVFVHGTLLPIPAVNDIHKNVANFFAPRGKILGQIYSTLVRENDFLGYQPIAHIGLHPIDRVCTKGANGAQLLAWWIQEIYNILPFDERADVDAYTFGWDGVLSDEHRKNQARNFLASLRTLVNERRSAGLVQGKDFDLIVLTHSHGGNLALYMVDWALPNESFFIDYLINLGTPIHEKTEKNLGAPLFKNVWNVYSKNDWIQVSDFISIQGSYKRKRVYESSSSKKLHTLKQILFEVDGRGPLHSEMWFFYRSWLQQLFKHPVPIGVFVPLMLHLVKKTKNSEHYLKMSLTCKEPMVHMSCRPFTNYDTKELSQTVWYECSFNFSNLLAYLFAIQRE